MTEDKYNGVLAVAKRQGPTSHDIVATMRRITNMRRIGHCGTLDPLATGVLILCLGRFTRLSDWLSRGEKEYNTTLLLGAKSNTYDAQGEITPLANVEPPSLGQIKCAVGPFTGTIEQVPPAFSAVKVNGVRSYKLARRNEAIALKARTVHITTLEVLDYSYPRLTLRVVCSRGTYIRSLAEDLGQVLGCGAYVESLCRRRIGVFKLEDALSLEQVERAVEQGQLERHFTPPQLALCNMEQVVLQADGLQAFSHGNPVSSAAGGRKGVGDVCAVYDLEKNLYGMGKWEGGLLRPLKVLRSFGVSP